MQQVDNVSHLSSQQSRYVTMGDVRAKTTRSRSSIKVPKTVTVAKTNQTVKRSRSRGATNYSAITTVGLGRTLRRGSQSGSKKSLTRSTSTIKRCDSNLKKISSSAAKSVTSTQMIVWGCNMSNQLGMKSQRSFISMPKKCTWNISIQQISCGLDHCALVTMEGNVYTFGSNQNGKLGQGQTGLQKPKVPTLVQSLASVNIKAVSCG